MEAVFYNEIFANELEMDFWCETYKVTPDVFDSKEYDEDEKVHVAFSSQSVPLYHKARDFQLDMWNRENEYNKASFQRKRLEEAGYNPYMNDAQAGTATGMSGASAASAAGAAP